MTTSAILSSIRCTARLRPKKSPFGYYKGRNKWENVRQIPTQNMRDALMNLIVYQGDTEFASVEQQRYLFETAPSDYDRSSLTRVMIEEMRHGWQMCALLIDHFGTTGKVEAQKMLERKAYENKRLLGSFQRRVRQLAGLLCLHRLYRPRRQISAADAEIFGLCAAGPLDELHAA